MLYCYLSKRDDRSTQKLRRKLEINKYFKVTLKLFNGGETVMLIKEIGKEQAYYEAAYQCKIQGISFIPDNAFYPEHTSIEEIK